MYQSLHIFLTIKIMFMTNRKRSGRGFASMDPEERREISSRGGRASHGQGRGGYDEDDDRRVSSRYEDEDYDDDDRYEDDDDDYDRRGSGNRGRYEDDEDDN